MTALGLRRLSCPCGAVFHWQRQRGRPPSYCSDLCRMRWRYIRESQRLYGRGYFTWCEICREDIHRGNPRCACERGEVQQELPLVERAQRARLFRTPQWVKDRALAKQQRRATA